MVSPKAQEVDAELADFFLTPDTVAQTQIVFHSVSGILFPSPVQLKPRFQYSPPLMSNSTNCFPDKI